MNPEFNQLGKLLIFTGFFIVVLGVLFLLGDKIPWLGKLHGDIYIKIKKKNFTFYFPIVTSIIISLPLTFVSKVMIIIRKQTQFL